MQKYSNSAQDVYGNALATASVTVYTDSAHTTKATIYSDNGVTVTTNPQTTTSLGEFSFYAADGRYYIGLSKTGITTQYLDDVLLFDPAASTGALGVGFLQSGTGATAETLQAAARRIVWVEQYGAKGDGTTDDATAIQAAHDAVSTAGGGIVMFDAKTYIVGTTLSQSTGVIFQGKGRFATTIKLKNTVNADLLRSHNFATLTGSTNWSAAQGVPYGFGLRGICFDGNGANQSAGNCVSYFGKPSVVEDVICQNAKQTGYYSECGSGGGVSTATDQPESRIDSLWCTGNLGKGFVYEGPHDAMLDRIVAAINGDDGITFDTSSNHSGNCEVGTAHSYGNTGNGIVVSAQVYASRLQGESNVKSGVVFTGSGAVNGVLDSIIAFGNDKNGTATYYEFSKVSTSGLNNIGMLQCLSTTALLASCNIAGNDTKIGRLTVTGSGSANTQTGLLVDASGTIIGGGLVSGFSGVGGTAVKTNVSGTKAYNDLSLLIKNSTTLWNNVNAGNETRYNFNLVASAGQTTFTGAGPQSNMSERWDAIRGDNNSTQVYGRQWISSSDFLVDSTGVKTVTVTHALIATPLIQAVSATVIKSTAVNDYVLNYVRTVSVSSTQIVFEVDVGTASATGGAAAHLAVQVSL